MPARRRRRASAPTGPPAATRSACRATSTTGREGQPLPGTDLASPASTLALGDDRRLGRQPARAAGTRKLDGGASCRVQAYYDRTDRDVPPTFGETLRHRRPAGAALVAAGWARTAGRGARTCATRATGSTTAAIVAFLPAGRRPEVDQPVRAGRDRAARRPAAHAGRAPRAQRLHRHRIPAQRTPGLEGRARAPAVGGRFAHRARALAPGPRRLHSRASRRSCSTAGAGTCARRWPRCTSWATAAGRRRGCRCR